VVIIRRANAKHKSPDFTSWPIAAEAENHIVIVEQGSGGIAKENTRREFGE